MILRLIAIALGGALGAVARYAVSAWVDRRFSDSVFPFGTLAVNASGSFALGLLLGLITADRLVISESTRALLVIGFLGAFTTFSTFSHETLAALRAGHAGIVFVNIALSLALALGACWLGWELGARA